MYLLEQESLIKLKIFVSMGKLGRIKRIEAEFESPLLQGFCIAEGVYGTDFVERSDINKGRKKLIFEDNQGIKNWLVQNCKTHTNHYSHIVFQYPVGGMQKILIRHREEIKLKGKIIMTDKIFYYKEKLGITAKNEKGLLKLTEKLKALNFKQTKYDIQIKKL